MPARLSCRIIGLGLCALFISASHSACANSSTVRAYISLRRSLGAATTSISSLKSNPAVFAGKTVELAGRIDGMMKSGLTTSFILNNDNDGLVVKGGEKTDPCISNGNTLRILVKVGQDPLSSLSDLQLEGAAYDYDVTRLEQESEAKSVKSTKRSVPPVLYRGSNPAQFPSAERGRGINLSSRAMAVYSPYKSAILHFNPRLTDQQADVITKSILAYSERYGVDPRLVIALIITESGFKPTATSRCGAMGLCQLMPKTARGLGVSNAYDPEQSIEASVRLMRGHLDHFGDLKLALSAYNAGPGAVKRHGGVPPYRETQNYIAKVSRLYKALCGQ